jgi:hypothetical protein
MGERSRIDELEAILNAPDGPPVTIRPDGTIEGMNMERELSFGGKAVGLTFNPSGDPIVLDLKQKAAALVDACHVGRNNTADNEVKRMYSLAVTEAQTAQMWAVKAATWRS